MGEVDDIEGGVDKTGFNPESLVNEQRVHERFRVSFKVLVRLSNGEIAHAHAVDLSMGGIYIEYGAPADTGVVFDMAFDLQLAHEFKRVLVKAKVVRTIVIGSRNMYGMAFVFTELMADAKKILSKYLRFRGLNAG